MNKTVWLLTMNTFVAGLCFGAFLHSFDLFDLGAAVANALAVGFHLSNLGLLRRERSVV